MEDGPCSTAGGVQRALREASWLALDPKRHSAPGLQQPTAKYCPLSEVRASGFSELWRLHREKMRKELPD